MPRPKRAEQFPPNEVAVAHCIQRCVRRAYLAGIDAGSQKSFEHRREWIRRRMELLASIFGMDVLSYAVLSNHIHVMLRTRPDVVKTWSDEDVASRWLRLFPGKKLEEYLGSPTQADIAKVLGDAKRLPCFAQGLAISLGLCGLFASPLQGKPILKTSVRAASGKDALRLRRLWMKQGLLACAMYVDLIRCEPPWQRLLKSRSLLRLTIALQRARGSKGLQLLLSLKLSLKMRTILQRSVIHAGNVNQKA
ncbi:MAG: hypothetical protein U0905_21590 [Pirellulales bacterium]